jgi:hypothetical protein
MAECCVDNSENPDAPEYQKGKKPGSGYGCGCTPAEPEPEPTGPETVRVKITREEALDADAGV